MPSLVAVAWFLPGRAKDLSATPPIYNLEALRVGKSKEGHGAQIGGGGFHRNCRGILRERHIWKVVIRFGE